MTVGKGLGTSTSTDMESVARVVVAAMVDGGVGVVAARLYVPLLSATGCAVGRRAGRARGGNPP